MRISGRQREAEDVPGMPNRQPLKSHLFLTASGEEAWQVLRAWGGGIRRSNG